MSAGKDERDAELETADVHFLLDLVQQKFILKRLARPLNVVLRIGTSSSSPKSNLTTTAERPDQLCPLTEQPFSGASPWKEAAPFLHPASPIPFGIPSRPECGQLSFWCSASRLHAHFENSFFAMKGAIATWTAYCILSIQLDKFGSWTVLTTTLIHCNWPWAILYTTWLDLTSQAGHMLLR